MKRSILLVSLPHTLDCGNAPNAGALAGLPTEYFVNLAVFKSVVHEPRSEWSAIVTAALSPLR
jgi:hypothetical protein